MKRVLLALSLLAVFALGRVTTSPNWLNPTLRLFEPPLEATYTPTPIKSLQQVVIALASATSNTATLSPTVVAANSILIYQGHDSDEGTGFTHGNGWIKGALTNGTTVTATAGVAADGSYNGAVVEFIPQFVKSSGCGTLTPSGTATITAVNVAKTLVSTTGYTNTYNTSSSVGVNGAVIRVTLTNATTITANAQGNNGGLTIGYCYLEFK
jgi:hypothetical protein